MMGGCALTTEKHPAACKCADLTSSKPTTRFTPQTPHILRAFAVPTINILLLVDTTSLQCHVCEERGGGGLQFLGGKEFGLWKMHISCTHLGFLLLRKGTQALVFN